MIYFLEDDDSIRELVIYTLRNTGMEAVGFSRPSAFWEAMQPGAAVLGAVGYYAAGRRRRFCIEKAACRSFDENTAGDDADRKGNRI